jgi:hypothetical protein
LTSELILQNHVADLFDLVRFSFALFGLKIQNFFNAFLGEDMVATAYSFIKTEGAKQLTEWFKGNVGIGGSQ